MSSVHGHENHEFLSSYIGIMPVPVVYSGVSQDIQSLWVLECQCEIHVIQLCQCGPKILCVFGDYVWVIANDSQVDTRLH